MLSQKITHRQPSFSFNASTDVVQKDIKNEIVSPVYDSRP